MKARSTRISQSAALDPRKIVLLIIALLCICSFVETFADEDRTESMALNSSITEQPQLSAPVIEAPTSIAVGQDITFTVTGDDNATGLNWDYHLEDGSRYTVWQTAFLNEKDGEIWCADGTFDPGNYYIHVVSYADGFRSAESVFSFSVTGERPDIGSVTITPKDPSDISTIDVFVDQDCEEIEARAVSGGMQGSGSSGNHTTLGYLSAGNYTIEVRVKIDNVWSKKYTEPIVVTEAPDADQPPIVLSYPESVQIGEQIVVELAENEQADSYYMYLYDSNDQYAGFVHSTDPTLIINKWEASAEPGLYTAIIRMESKTYDTRDIEDVTLEIVVEEATSPTIVPVFDQDVYEKTFIVPFDAEGLFNFNLWGFYGPRIQNAASLSEWYGDTSTITVEQVSGEDRSISEVARIDNGTVYLYLQDNDVPTEATEQVYRVTCAWGGQSGSCLFLCHWIEMEPPIGTSIPDVITMTVGQSISFVPRLYPDEWSDLADVYINGGYDDNMVDCHWSYLNTPKELVIEALNAGICVVELDHRVGNMTYTSRHTVYIADETGYVPDTLPHFSDESIEYTMLVVKDDWDDRYSFDYSTEVARSYIVNYDELCNYFNEEPRWECVQVSGEPLEYRCNGSGGQRILTINSPDAATEAIFEIRCTWRNLTAILPVTVHVLDAAMPDGISIPDVVDLAAGQDFNLTGRFLPIDWAEGNSINMSLNLDPIYDDAGEPLDDLVSASPLPDKPDTIVLHGLYPGYQQAYVYFDYANLHYYSDAIILRVADEEGLIPDPELKITGWSSLTRARVAEGFELYDAWDEYAIYSLDSCELLGQLLTGSPVWTFEHDGGDDVAFALSVTEDPEENWYDCTPEIIRWPERDMELHCVISCEWDGLSVSKEVTMHLLKNRIVAWNVPDMIETTIDETYVFEPGLLMEDGSVLPASDRLYVSMENYGNAEAEITQNEDRCSYSITPTHVGYNMLWVEMICSLYEVRMNVPIHITDPDGSDENPELLLYNYEYEEFGEEDAAISSMVIAPLGKRLDAPYSSGELETEEMFIYNYDLLEIVFGGKPEWTFVQTSGDTIEAEITGEDTPILKLKSMPAHACEVVLQVTCSWGGMTSGGKWIISFLERELPTGLAGPALISLEMGETDYDMAEYRFLPEDPYYYCWLSDLIPDQEGIIACYIGFGAYIKAIGIGYTDAVATFQASNGVFYSTRIGFCVTDKSNAVRIDTANFPDDAFRAYVSETFDTDGDGELSDAEILEANSIDVCEMGIGSLQGIEYFSSLTSLDCSCNALTQIDVSNNTELKRLDCSYNALTQIDVSNNKELKWLYCMYDHLSDLDISQNTKLMGLSCHHNDLTCLDVSSVSTFLEYWMTDQWIDLDGILYYGIVSDNGDDGFYVDPYVRILPERIEIDPTNFPDAGFRAYVAESFDTNGDGILSEMEVTAVTEINITEKDISSLEGIAYFTHLTKLSCSSNQLTVLDLSGNPSVAFVRCHDNLLTDLVINGCTQLKELDCSWNRLRSLDVGSCADLESLICYGNQMTDLNVSGCASLKELICNVNSLDTLDLSECPMLDYLRCQDNDLSFLDMSGCTSLVDCVRLGASEILGSGCRAITYGNTAIYCDPQVGFYLGSNPMGLPDLSLPASIKSIEEEAFMGISASSVKIPDGAHSIGACAFADCLNLRAIYIPSSVNDIADTAFSNMNNVMIYGERGSEAESFAKEHGIVFVELAEY